MKCAGCGIKLQYINPELPGYIRTDISSALGEEAYCERCFNIIHHGKHYDPILSNKEYYNKIDCIKDKKAIVLLIIDILNITDSFIPNMSIHIGSNPVIICVNKVDIMPKDVHLHNIETQVRSIAAKENLNVSSVIMMSSLKKKNIDLVIEKIEKLKYKLSKSSKDHFDTYVLGCASTGKSTFINSVKQLYSNNKTLLTTSSQYQTTVDFVKVAYLKNCFMIDTPGYINYSSYGSRLLFESQEILNPKSYLKPKTFQLNNDQTIFLGGLARIDFCGEGKVNASFYVSNNLYLHRTKTINADDCYKNHVKELLSPPTNDLELEKVKIEEITEFSFNETSDLFIAGIGFIHIKGENMKVIVHTAKGISVKLLKSIM